MAADISRLHAITSTADAPIVGVAITITDHLNTHAGILYKDERDDVLLLQLAFHVQLQNTPFDPTYLCADPGLEAEDAEAIAGHCRSIARGKPPVFFEKEMRYALHYNPKASVGIKEGRLLLLKEGKGLNCVTFVLAIFKGAGPNLVDSTGWPERSEDVPWHRHLVKMLKKHAPVKYWKRVAKDIGCARVRPEELAGACIETTRPSTHVHCIPNGQIVLAKLSAHTGRVSRW